MSNIKEIINNQKEYFSKGETLDIAFRKKQLDMLHNEIKKYETEILESLKLDLNKSNFEGYATEISMVYEEIKYIKKNLSKLSKPKYHKSPMVHFPSISKTIYDPYGLVLIMSPWNYPFQLTISPLIGAISAGNCVLVKPSEYSPHTSKIITKILSIFDSKYISVVNGGLEVNQALLEEKFDYIFFTGSTKVGKIVMEKASKYLTPITLELGGKSPCIVEKSANIDLSAKRIVWGKLLNAGQTCVAPDYIYVDSSIKDELIKAIKKYITIFFGDEPQNNDEYPKIINNQHFDRLCALIPKELQKVNTETLQIAPVILDNCNFDSEIMKDEIFGPIFPILEFKSIEEVIQRINSLDKPLALYLFTTSKEIEKTILKRTFFGGGVINDTIIHVANNNIPFGGVSTSGIGRYHGKDSFYEFSHTKSIMKRGTFLDINIRYAPFKDKLNLLRKLM